MADIRVTQDVIEILSQPTPDIRVTQYVIEVLSSVAVITPTVTEISYITLDDDPNLYSS
jgi:hypothetical protein